MFSYMLNDPNWKLMAEMQRDAYPSSSAGLANIAHRVGSNLLRKPLEVREMAEVSPGHWETI